MGRDRQPTLVSWAQSAYEPAPSFEDWVETVTGRASGLVEGGHGAAGRILDTRVARTRGGYSVHVEHARVEDALREHEVRSAHRLDFLLESQTVSKSRRGSRRVPEDPYLARVKRHFDKAGVYDMLHLTAFDERDAWVTVGLLVPQGVVPGWSLRAWTQAQAHFGRAVRLQRRASDLGCQLRSRLSPLDQDLIESPRCALREAVRRLDATGRAGSIRAPEEVWQGVIDGSWSLVDQHDREGRRFLVVSPNPPGVRDLRALSSREATVAALAAEGRGDKWIAWALGIERTTVANHLHAALEKLGLDSTVALARAFQASGYPRGPLDDDLPTHPSPSLSVRLHDLDVDAVVLAFDLSASPGETEGLLLDRLSPGERRVVELAVQGLQDVEIAQRICRSRHTVSNQLRRAYAKLHVGGRVELAAVVRSGLRAR